MVLTATSVLADGRGPDLSSLGGILIIIGVIILAVAAIATVAWLLVRRSGRGDARTGPDEGSQPPRRVGRVRGSG